MMMPSWPPGRRRAALPFQQATLLCLTILRATAGVAAQDASASEGCLSGCPHMLDLVCGADGNTYQSRCLALCQGVGIVSDGPCEDTLSGSHPDGRLQLHKLLINTNIMHEDSETQSRHRTDHDTIDQPGQGSSSRRSLSAARRVLTQTDMQLFKPQNFSLVGLVQLHDYATALCNRASAQSERASTQYAALDDSVINRSKVRALRITKDGLLYTANYDLAALSTAIREAARSDSLEEVLGKTALQADTSSTEDLSPPAGEQCGTEQSSMPVRDIRVCSGLPSLRHHEPRHRRRQLSDADPQATRRLQQTRSPPPRSPPPRSPPPRSPPPRSPPPRSPPPRRSPPPAASTMSMALQSDAPAPPPPRRPSVNMTPCGDALPFTAVGQLQLQDSSGAYVCSGSMVSPDAVLTAAHCVFRRDNAGGGNFFSRLDFAAGRYNENNKTYNPFGVTQWAYATIFAPYEMVPEGYVFDWDVAIIKMATAVGNESGWLGIASGCPVNAATGLPASTYVVNTAGYPADRPFGTCLTSRCAIVGDTCNRTAQHTCNSLDGQSGSPFYMSKDLRIRGILVGTYNSTDDTPIKVTHIVGTDSYSAVLKWIAEPLPRALQDNGGDLTGVNAPSPNTPPPASSSDSSGGSTPNSGTINVTQMDGSVPGGFPDPPAPKDQSGAPVYPPPRARFNVTTDSGINGTVMQDRGVAESFTTSAQSSTQEDQTTSSTSTVRVNKKAGKWVRKTRTRTRTGRRLAQTQAQAQQVQ